MSSTNDPQVPANYKYRDLKVYSSDEWMADATKKYRRVFERYETTYMRVELSFYNKEFDETEWEAHIRLKCFHVNGSQKNELCNLEQQRKVLKDENIVYVRQSWGNATPGSYWLKGAYQWEAYINDVKVGEAKFSVEDIGQSKPGENIYFDIDSIKLFEGNLEAIEAPEKKFLKTFSQPDTRYVWCEFKFRPKTNEYYMAEIILNFYTDAGQLKGSASSLVFVQADSKDKVYTMYSGWGNEVAGRWSKDLYSMQVVFMDNLIATVPFHVGDAAEEGNSVVVTGSDALLQIQTQGKPAGTPAASVNTLKEDLLQESLAELNALTGLEQIKKDVYEMVQLVKFYQEMGKDVLSKFSLHTVFTGNPGTGKTTVARIIAKIYKGLGILEKGHLVEVDREGLVAGYVGQTAIKTAEKVTEAMGGILFIDEAYSLAIGKGSQYDFGAETIQVILKRMEDNRGKFGVIVAGYTENMHEFISSNPGLKSRFDSYFEFPDYTPDEMFVIATNMFKREEAQPDAAATAHLRNYFTFLHNHRDQHFGNARSVRQVVGESVKNQHLRLAAMKREERTPEMMSTIILADVQEFEIKQVKSSHSAIGFRTGKSE